MILHTISSSTINIDLINSNDAVLFWQNGVVLAIKDNPTLTAILAKTQYCYALDNDILARGLTPLIDKRITIIDMANIISLTEIYHPQIKW